MMSIFRMVTMIGLRESMRGNKGMNGEKAVRRALRYFYTQEEPYEQLDNIGFYDEEGMSHQIDHIVIRNNGVFCIETKNISGLVFGSESQGTWTQCLSEGKKHHFLNPLIQNEGHIKQLDKVLEGKYKINSIVVMVQNNADKIICNKVVNLSNLVNYLLDFNDGTNLSKEEVSNIAKTILEKGRYITKKEHIRNIKNNKSNL